MSLQALRELEIDRFLHSRDWDEETIQLAMSHIVSRAVYPASELKTTRFIHENSSICALTGYPEKQVSKEKRSDCPLIVLALVVNVEGFIKYSALLKGNIADCKTLGEMVDNLRTVTSTVEKRAIVVIDAGIATTGNLALLKQKGYDYVCVSRSRLKQYSEATSDPVCVKDNRGRDIALREVKVENGDSEYYLKVESPQKALKEKSMNNLFVQRFEEELTQIAAGIHKKGGVKNYGKVCERIGRLKAKYRSANKMFSIEIEKGDKDKCKAIRWRILPEAVIENREEHGVYFLKTSLQTSGDRAGQEALIWTIYNCIRHIESSFHTLKTDLDLRPVYHQTDEASLAHLHLGLLAYWLVNTVRKKQKKQNICNEWSKIVRKINKKKIVTTCVKNKKNQRIRIRKCSKPADKVKRIYDALGYKYAPFVRKKSVVNKNEFLKNECLDLLDFSSG
jgi:hypothetical protein